MTELPAATRASDRTEGRALEGGASQNAEQTTHLQPRSFTIFPQAKNGF